MKRAAAATSAVAVAAAAVSGMAACAPETTPGGGLVVLVSVDPSLSAAPPTALRATVGASLDGGGPTYFDAGYAIVHFPTSFAVDSNGDPNATVAIDLSLWVGTQQVERQRFVVDHVPSTTVKELPVVFGSACGASGPVPPDAGPAACPLKSWCAWTGSYWLCQGGLLPGPGVDAGWPERGTDAAADAAGDATTEGAVADSSVVADSTVVADSPVDQTVGDADAASDAEMADAPRDTGAVDAPLTIPCDAPCGPGQTCVDGQCVAVPPSCRGGAAGAGTNCGLFGNDDCCASDEVAAGGFFRDYDGHTYTDMSWPATVSQFRLDRYDVTVGRFRAFVDDVVARGWTPPEGWGKHAYLDGGGLNNGGDAGTVPEKGWDPSWNAYVPQTKTDWDAKLQSCLGDSGYQSWTWTPTSGPNENLPIDCVSWHQAYAFCIWDGAFLPSDTEWDYAAAGGENQREYPWGDVVPNPMYAIYDCYYPATPQGNDCRGVASIAPVGSVPAGRALWGQLDLAGNVLEWTLDYAFASSSPPVPCHDCAQTADGTERVIRGSGWDSNDKQLFSALGYGHVPEGPLGDVGVRCARPP